MHEQVARMKQSEIRGCLIVRKNPGLRCARSGLRLLQTASERASIARLEYALRLTAVTPVKVFIEAQVFRV
jgi:hypothetical protein